MSSDNRTFTTDSDAPPLGQRRDHTLVAGGSPEAVPGELELAQQKIRELEKERNELQRNLEDSVDAVNFLQQEVHNQRKDIEATASCSKEKLDFIAGLKNAIPEFNGSGQLAADTVDFLRKCNDFVEATTLTHKEVCSIISSKITGSASHWLAAEKSRNPQICTSWIEMEKSIRDKFLPFDTEYSLIKELHLIRQGNQTVQDYSQTFVKTASIITGLSEVAKACLFNSGLKTNIQISVESVEDNLKSLDKSIKAALRWSIAEGAHRPRNETAEMALKTGRAANTDEAPPKYCWLCRNSSHRTRECPKKAERHKFSRKNSNFSNRFKNHQGKRKREDEEPDREEQAHVTRTAL
jgi:Retrotransposon gag protein